MPHRRQRKDSINARRGQAKTVDTNSIDNLQSNPTQVIALKHRLQKQSQSSSCAYPSPTKNKSSVVLALDLVGLRSTTFENKIRPESWLAFPCATQWHACARLWVRSKLSPTPGAETDPRGSCPGASSSKDGKVAAPKNDRRPPTKEETKAAELPMPVFATTTAPSIGDEGCSNTFGKKSFTRRTDHDQPL